MSLEFVLIMHGNAPKRMTNVRDNKIQYSSFWKSPFVERWYLVPANSVNEPKGEKAVTWYLLAL